MTAWKRKVLQLLFVSVVLLVAQNKLIIFQKCVGIVHILYCILVREKRIKYEALGFF